MNGCSAVLLYLYTALYMGVLLYCCTIKQPCVWCSAVLLYLVTALCMGVVLYCCTFKQHCVLCSAVLLYLKQPCVWV